MTPEATGLVITAVSGGIATIIYAFKNIKKSECCGCECEQRVPASPPSSKPQSLNDSDAVINIIGNTEV